MPQRKRKNPFYVLLMIVGTMFALTACAYGVMTVRMGRAAPPTPGDQFFDAYGMWLMGGQLTLLTLLTFAAIGTDDYWTRDTDDSGEDVKEEPPATTEDEQ